MGGSVKKAFSNPVRAATTVATFGTSELARRTPIGKAVASLPERLSDGLLGTRFVKGGGGIGGDPEAAKLQGINGGQSPTEMLAQSGGAPLLANIAMGVNPDAAIAGFFGKTPDQWEAYKQTLNPDDLSAIESVTKQLHTIQSNTDLRNLAVQKVVDDFPNVMAQAAQARQQSGEEFDTTTKAVMDQVSNQLSAKYASTGGFSSGAFNQGLAAKAGDVAMNKLQYMDQRGQNDFAQRMQGYNTRLGEVNALRGFQQTMLGQGVQQGFSAMQNNLQRNMQGQMQNQNLQFQQNQTNANNAAQSQNQMLGALGGLAGTAAGMFFGGPVGASIGGQVGGSLAGGLASPASPRLNLNSGTGYSKYSGGY